ncbi:hypothetical protein [Geodermatophilus sp. SYSU D01176]
MRWSAVLVALGSSAVHVLALATGAAPSSVQVVVVLLMGMACLPCAVHLALWPRRRTWVQTAAVSAAMLVGHPLLSAVGTGHHGTAHGSGAAAGVGVAMVVLPALGLVLASAGLSLQGARTTPTGPAA